MGKSVVIYWPLILYAALAVVLVGGMSALSALLGQRHRAEATDEIFESGIVSTGSARIRFDAKFYLMAMFFVVFDLEAVFVFAYAVSFRELGWAGYLEMLIFIAILVVALFYLWRLKALDWGSCGRRVSNNP